MAVPPCVDTFTKYSAAWPRLILVSARCTLTHRLPALGAKYASSDDVADFVGEAEELLDLADGDVEVDGVGDGELVGVDDPELDEVGGAVVGGGVVGGGVVGGGVVGGGVVGGGVVGGGVVGGGVVVMGSCLHTWSVPAAEAAA